LSQAVLNKQGGAPFGPAGTGKTETVKSLAAVLGRLCIVFNCDAAFDLPSMGRIFSGLCQTGAWGCFDEFNRLEENVLSAVSQQIFAIQTALRSSQALHSLELHGHHVKLDPNVAIFVTMNLGYAGRATLPDNLKQLFRSVAMTKPNSAAIAEITLFTKVLCAAAVLFVRILMTVCPRDSRMRSPSLQKLSKCSSLALMSSRTKNTTTSV
jgi:dynein heavy chain 1